jgi:hypothetical protein
MRRCQRRMRAKMRVGCKFSLVEGQDSTVGVSDNELHDRYFGLTRSHVNRKLAFYFGAMVKRRCQRKMSCKMGVGSLWAVVEGRNRQVER